MDSCPFFRNEIGGEGERGVAVGRESDCSHKNGYGNGDSGSDDGRHRLHRPVAAATLSCLEPEMGKSHWRHALCPYLRNSLAIEAADTGAEFFKTYFIGQGNFRS